MTIQQLLEFSSNFGLCLEVQQIDCRTGLLNIAVKNSNMYQICLDNLGTENAEVTEKGETSSEEPNNLHAAEVSHELPVNNESKNDQEPLEKLDNTEIMNKTDADKVRLSKFIF